MSWLLLQVALTRDDLVVAAFVPQVLLLGALIFPIEGPVELISRVVDADLIFSLLRIIFARSHSLIHLVLHVLDESVALCGPLVVLKQGLVVKLDFTDLCVLLSVERVEGRTLLVQVIPTHFTADACQLFERLFLQIVPCRQACIEDPDIVLGLSVKFSVFIQLF